MRTASYRLFKFRIPLSQHIIIKNKEIKYRTGIIIELRDEERNTGYGECSPLPGLHDFQIDQIASQMAQAADKIVNRNIEYDNSIKTFNLKAHPNRIINFALESALLNLLSCQMDIPARKILSDNSPDILNINGLISGNKKWIIKQSQKLIDTGFSTIKLKTGRNPVNDDIDIVNSLLNILPDYCKLRLDCNMGWDLSTAELFINNVDMTRIEYIEEPLKDYLEFKKLFEKTGCPIAQDESLYQHNYIFSEAKAFIIKAVNFAGLHKIYELAKRAAQQNTDIIFSDIFSAGTGIIYQMQLAAAFGSDKAMGFDTYSYLASDILFNRIQFNSGKVYLRKIDEKIDLNILEKIY